MSAEKIGKKVPQHIGFILDGNRRWAKAKGLPTLEGHRRGFNRLMELVENCIDKGVKHVTVFAFSTENWERSPEEVTYLMNLFREMLKKPAEKLKKLGVRVKVAGRLEDFEEDLRDGLNNLVQDTAQNNAITFNLGLSYGGRPEILDATKKIVTDGIRPGQITEELFSKYIYEAGQPDPEIIVRTSGEQRTSGFMLWQAAYAELYFTDVCWPDFDGKELDKVIAEYNRRERRFGK